MGTSFEGALERAKVKAARVTREMDAQTGGILTGKTATERTATRTGDAAPARRGTGMGGAAAAKAAKAGGGDREQTGRSQPAPQAGASSPGIGFAQAVGPDRYGRTPGPAVSKRRPQGGSATGEYTTVVKGLQETGERLEKGAAQLDKLYAAYESGRSPAAARIYNTVLDRVLKDQAEYDKLVERYGYFTTAEGVKELTEEARPLAQAAQRELSDARAAMTGAETYRDMELGKRRVEAAEQGLKRVEEYNDLLGLYYEAENEEKLKTLKGDKGALEQYTRAKELGEDIAKVEALMGVSGALETAERAQARKYIQEKYGLDDRAMRQDAALGGLWKKLRAEQDRAAQALAEAGDYDYGRMERYARMKADREAYARKQEEWRQFAEKHSGAASALTVLASPAQGLDALRLLGDGWGHSDDRDLAGYEPANIYGMDVTNFVSEVRGAVSEKLAKKYDWEIFGQNVAAFAYQTGMSIADSAVQVRSLGKAATLFMGASSASNQAKSVIQRGGTNKQAFWGGLTAGAAECIFEYVSIDKLLSARSVGNMKDLLRETVKQAGVEASEEMLTEISNILTDAAIMGSRSDYAQMVEGYRQQGLSYQEAKKRAFLDCVGQVVWAGAGGALSGGVMGGAVSAVNYVGGKMLPRGDGRPAVMEEQGQKVTAPEVGAVREYHGLVLDAVRENLPKIQGMEPVASLTGEEFQKTAGDTRSLRAKVLDFFNSIGNKVTRSDIGEIELNNAGARDSTAHGYGKLKAATFAALPAVLEQGKIIAVNGPYEGHDYDSYFISAPVTVNGTPCYVGAIVIKDQWMQRYKVHEVLTTSESGTPLFKSESLSTSTESPLRNGVPLETSGDASTDTTIPQSGDGVNTQYAQGGGEDTTGMLPRGDAPTRAAVPARGTPDPYGGKAAYGSAEPGLVRDGYVRGSVDAAVADRVDAVAKALGLRVRYVESIQAGLGEANERLTGAEMLLSQDMDAPEMFVVGHGLTHRLQELAPKEYNAFKESVRGQVEGEVGRIMELYRNNGLEMDEAGALDEAVADYAGQMIEDGAVLDEFIRRHREDRGLLEKLRDAIRSIIDRLTGRARAKARTAEGKLAAAYEAAAGAAKGLPIPAGHEQALSGEAAKTLPTAAQWAQEQSGRYMLNKEFSREIDAWDGKAQRTFHIGTTSEALQSIGVEDRNIVWFSGKIAEILNKHKGMTLDIIKQVPQILENPVAVLKSQQSGSRIAIFGEVYDANGAPVTAILELQPTDRGGRLIDMNVVASAYGKDTSPAKFVENSELLYLDKDKNRTQRWLNGLGLQLPSFTTALGSMGTISYQDGKVKIEGVPYKQYMQSDGNDTGNFMLKGEYKPPAQRTTQARLREVEGAMDRYFDARQGLTAEETAAAKVRTEMPGETRRTLRETAEREWGAFRRKMVDSGDTVARIGKQVGDSALYAYYNFARAASSTAGNALRAGGAQTDVMGRKVGKSLADIFEPVRAKGEAYYQDFQLYLFHRHNVDRMSRDNQTGIDRAQAALNEFDEGAWRYARMPESDLAQLAAEGDMMAQERLELLNAYNRAKAVRNKPVFGYEVTAEESARLVRELEGAHPEFEELAQEVYQYNRNLMQYRVDSGLLTREQADHIEEVYPHYVPTYRLTEQETARARAKGERVGKTVGRAEGGTAELQPIHRAMAEQTYKVIREGAKNRFGARLLDDATGQNGGAARRYIHEITDAVAESHEDTFDLREDPTPRLENTFTVYRDGKAYRMTVDRGLFEGIEALSPKQGDQSKVFQLVRSANDLFKGLVTGYNPTFTGKNFFRDLQEAGLYSKDGAAWAKNYPQALKEIATDGEWWQLYQALGGVYSSVFDYRQGYKLEKDHGALRRGTLDKVEALNMAVEQAPRLAEFMAQAKKNGAQDMDSLMEAMLAAADVTTNFGRSGSWGKFLNQTFVPFLNPSIQGLDKMGKRFLGKKTAAEWGKLAARCALLGILPAILNGLMNRGEDGWDEIRDSDKDVYWLFHLGDGKYLRIPKGRDISVIQMGAMGIWDAINGREVDVSGKLRTAANQVAPPNPLENNILAAWMDAQLLDKKSPGKTWYGADIESRRLQSYAPEERYDGKTDVFSKWLGKALKLSPKKIHYLLDQYSGVVGDFVLPMLTPAGDKNITSPFTGAFVLDSVTSNKISEEFYDISDEINYAKNGGDGAMAVASRYWSKQTKAVNDIYAHIRELEESDLPNKERQEEIRQAKAILNGIMKNAIAGFEVYRKAAEENYIGEDDAQIAEAVRQTNREVFGAEYALQVYNSDVYEKAVGAHERGIDYDLFYEAYFSQKGVTGDKDGKGNSIPLSASRKKKEAIDAATPGATRKEREILYEIFGVSEKVWTGGGSGGRKVSRKRSGGLPLPRGDEKPAASAAARGNASGSGMLPRGDGKAAVSRAATAGSVSASGPRMLPRGDR